MHYGLPSNSGALSVCAPSKKRGILDFVSRAVEKSIDTLRRWQWKDPHCFNLGGGFTYFYNPFLDLFLLYLSK